MFTLTAYLQPEFQGTLRCSDNTKLRIYRLNITSTILRADKLSSINIPIEQWRTEGGWGVQPPPPPANSEGPPK